MENLWLNLLTFVAIPVFAILIDGIAALRARKISYTSNRKYLYNFTILVPIYGRTKYLENVAYLRHYGKRVILCTTGDESSEFYQELQQIADENGFQIYKDPPLRSPSERQNPATARATSGTIRDRLIRNALASRVTTKYVIPLDADSFSVKPLSLLVGELCSRKLDIASIRLVLTNRYESLLTRLQYHEYQMAMQLRFVFPWMVSGACQVAKTSALKEIMSNHSLFFQGNDVEIGIISTALRYKIGHIPFEVSTAVPATLKAWYRQRLAWAGGEFRLFIPNFSFVLQHAYLWLYGGIVVILLFPFRWITLTNPSLNLLSIFGFYAFLVLFLHWHHRDRWLFLMPFYSLFLSLVMTPLGIIWYFVMARKDRNFGIIMPKRNLFKFSSSF